MTYPKLWFKKKAVTDVTELDWGWSESPDSLDSRITPH